MLLLLMFIYKKYIKGIHIIYISICFWLGLIHASLLQKMHHFALKCQMAPVLYFTLHFPFL